MARAHVCSFMPPDINMGEPSANFEDVESSGEEDSLESSEEEDSLESSEEEDSLEKRILRNGKAFSGVFESIYQKVRTKTNTKG